MVAFIDQHRAPYGVEPICRVLPIAPSTYFLRKAQQQDPTTRSARAQRDDALRAAIQRLWDEHDQAYGPRKVWQQARGWIRLSGHLPGAAAHNAVPPAEYEAHYYEQLRRPVIEGILRPVPTDDHRSWGIL